MNIPGNNRPLFQQWQCIAPLALRVQVVTDQDHFGLKCIRWAFRTA